MSAWVVEREHIDVMLRKALDRQLSWRASDDGEPVEWRTINSENISDIGRMLAEENVASVCYRYPDDTADLYEALLAYEYRDPRYVLTPGETFKTVGCFDYQSCEHDEWMTSEAHRFCDALVYAAAEELSTGPWGWDAKALREAKLPNAATHAEP